MYLGKPETLLTVTTQVEGQKEKKANPFTILRKTFLESSRFRTCGKVAAGAAENQLERGDSFIPIAFELPISETVIIKQPLTTAAEGVTWHAWMGSSWQCVSWAACSVTLLPVFLRFHNQYDYIVSCFFIFDLLKTEIVARCFILNLGRMDCNSHKNLLSGMTWYDVQLNEADAFCDPVLRCSPRRSGFLETDDTQHKTG